MEWEQALRQHLLVDAACAALIGGRVFWRVRPQAEALPCLVLTVVSDPDPQTLAGKPQFRFSRVQVDCLADGGQAGAEKTKAQVTALRKAAAAALQGPFLQDGVQFGRSQIEPRTDRTEQTQTGWIHRDQFDVLLWHN